MASAGARLRERLGHPVVDVDGHTIEFAPLMLDTLREIAGEDVAHRYQGARGSARWYDLTDEERRSRRVWRTPWWFETTHTLDRATSMLPSLLRARLDEFGIDHSVLYPTHSLRAVKHDEDEVRQAACRAYNVMQRRLFDGLEDRLTPVAAIPVHTPEEAVAEVEFAVGELGYRAVVMPGHVRRPVPAVAAELGAVPPSCTWVDPLGLDSEYDYDPLWECCQRLGVVASFHVGSTGWGSRTSISSYVFNHIGHFASSHEATAKALLLGGVTRRFPRLRFAFLEGGVAWAVALVNDLVSHWHKRNGKSVLRYSPENLDGAHLERLFAEHGGPSMAAREGLRTELAALRTTHEEDVLACDEFEAVGVADEAELVALFVERFWFGCEADDPLAALAFDPRFHPENRPLRACMGSDIGHWDVPDASRVLLEAYELVEESLLDEQQFRDFVFANAVRLYSAGSPDFFAGTSIEGSAREVILTSKEEST